ncbi:MAG: phosphotransferase family protein [Hamadaea sp.]|uniref:phosphotransferase family protein n=1 Tax=Hamadaea sp. TaxID=2024425 RepID=UPI001825729F|nr:phosphotransferase family protein [Hamadaea sp.]NUR69874.1 phosphotransferase family protein [Hamadaea sp.]NUT22070.1 phosphotransferase family protein [Hamadaea sp.]
MTAPMGLELARVRACLDRVRPGLVQGELSGDLIQGGKSNLTYRVGDGTTTWVVRRPPLGHVLRTAHDMSREHRVISALGATRVPVPAAIAFCEPETEDAAPFYVMQDVDGTIYRTAAEVAALGAERAHALAYALVDVLADLHTVDPAGVGLADFGRPEGYLQRQVRRWKQQLDASRSRELPGVEDLFERLTAQIPAESGAAIVHGDFRLDNVIVNQHDQIVAVLDWEMATLGDPLADLGLSLVYWDLWLRPTGLFGEAAPVDALPTSADLAARYAQRRPFAESLDWYLAFAYFKIAVILEGIHFRHLAGQTVGSGFDQVGAMVPGLVTAGLRQMREA